MSNHYSPDEILKAIGLNPEVLSQMGLTAHVVFVDQALKDEPVVIGELEDSEVFTQKTLMLRAKEMHQKKEELKLEAQQLSHDLEKFQLSLSKRMGIHRSDLISPTLDNKILAKKSAAIREGLQHTPYKH